MFVGRLPELDPFVCSDSGSHTSPSSRVITCSGLEVFLFVTRCPRQRGVRSVLLIDSLEVFM